MKPMLFYAVSSVSFDDIYKRNQHDKKIDYKQRIEMINKTVDGYSGAISALVSAAINEINKKKLISTDSLNHIHQHLLFS